jgi:hypothetical protein
MPSKKYVKDDGGVNLKVRFTDKPITGWGGLVVMSKWFAKIGVREVAGKTFEVFDPGSNRGYKPWELIISFMVAIYMGANRVAHIDLVRWDAPVRAMFALTRVPSASSMLRFFRKFNLRHVSVLMPEWNRRMMELARDRFCAGGDTLDLDSSVFERYGEQEGAKKGYNPRKPGRPSHHPIFAVAADSRWVLHLWLRGGDTVSASRAVDFIRETLNNKPNWLSIMAVRADSGFFSGKVFDFFEEVLIPYTIVAKANCVVREAVMGITEWCEITTGIEIGETTYRAQDWKKARRVVAVRQRREERPKAQGRLFPECSAYRYQMLVTTRPDSPQDVWRHYNKRADIENRIKEWKDDFFMRGFAMKKFHATEATLWMVAMAFNITEWFRSTVMDKAAASSRLMTIRIKNFICGGWLGFENGHLVLRLNARSRLRLWIENSLSFLDSFSVPIAAH